jgi:hypothetical protein
MFLRPNYRAKDGKDHIHWSLVETVRTVDGPRQRTLCYLGELNGSAQARWLKSVEVFNEQGDVEQLKLFPSHVEVPDDDPQVARVLVNRVRLERTRQFGGCFLGWELWKRLGLDQFFAQAMDAEAAEVPWSRVAAVFRDELGLAGDITTARALHALSCTPSPSPRPRSQLVSRFPEPDRGKPHHTQSTRARG